MAAGVVSTSACSGSPCVVRSPPSRIRSASDCTLSNARTMRSRNCSEQCRSAAAATRIGVSSIGETRKHHTPLRPNHLPPPFSPIRQVRRTHERVRRRRGYTRSENLPDLVDTMKRACAALDDAGVPAMLRRPRDLNPGPGLGLPRRHRRVRQRGQGARSRRARRRSCRARGRFRRGGLPRWRTVPVRLGVDLAVSVTGDRGTGKGVRPRSRSASSSSTRPAQWARGRCASRHQATGSGLPPSLGGRRAPPRAAPARGLSLLRRAGSSTSCRHTLYSFAAHTRHPWSGSVVGRRNLRSRHNVSDYVVTAQSHDDGMTRL